MSLQEQIDLIDVDNMRNGNPEEVASVWCTFFGTSNRDNIKLPTIKLPNFNGEKNCFLEFRDLFGVLVDDTDDVIEKFYHFKSCFLEEPCQIISKLVNNAYNYPIAWKWLEVI